MIGLVIKAPLANNEVCTCFLQMLNHIYEELLLLSVESVILLNRIYIYLVRRLWFRRFKRTCEHGNLSVTDALTHPGVRHLLIY
eukprot:XP_001704086.1 Thermosome beta subunit [Giardia lamblia ATCC 50803]